MVDDAADVDTGDGDGGVVATVVGRGPGLHRPRFECPHCDAFAQQDWYPLATGGDMEAGGGNYLASEGALGYASHRSLWHAAQCGSCHDWSIWHRDRMVHPGGHLGPAAHPDMPLKVRDLYREAAAVAAVSSRAGAAFARVVVERLLRTLEPDGPAKLELLIARIKRQGITTSLGQMLDVVRVTGNEAVHVTDNLNDLMVLVLDGEQGPELVELLLQTANDLVEELITKPRRAGELSAKIPPGIRARIEQLTTTEQSGTTGG